MHGGQNMKDIRRLLCIPAAILLAIALTCGIGLWLEAREIEWQTNHLHELPHILTFAENKGADWATDELMADGVERFSKKSLYKKWGEPTESAEIPNEDVWSLSDQFQLIVQYNEHDQIERVTVVPRS